MKETELVGHVTENKYRKKEKKIGKGNQVHEE
jgi:hypothetical protein